MTPFSNKNGLSSLAALFTLLSLVAMGAVIAYLVGAGETSSANNVLSTQAFYVTQAGIEYGVKKIYDSQNEIVDPPGITFGRGSFTISRSGRTLTVTGTVGSAVRVNKVDSPTQADCTVIDTTGVNNSHDGKTISGISFKKICLVSATIDKMQFDWVTNNGEKLTKVKIESSTLYNNAIGASSGTLIDVADYVMNNGNNNVMNQIVWNSDMSNNKTITMSFTMGDTSIKTATFNANQ